MTPKMGECLQFIEGYIQKTGYSPTMRDIVEGMELSSTSSAHRLVHGLAERKKINILGNRARSIELVSLCKCPACGHQWKPVISDTIGDLNHSTKEKVNGYAQNAENPLKNRLQFPAS